MLTRIEVVMDSGGTIAEAGSQKEHFTNGFGGCTAFHAKTDSGLYGLYHLSGTSDRKPQMVENATDTNEPFRDWIQALALALKEHHSGQILHFEIGTPWLFGNNTKIKESHPQLGMERYLKGLCAKYGIEHYDITLINMIGVESIVVSEKGMTCYGSNEQKTNVCPAKYQTDAEIFEHLGWTNEQCLRYVTADNNVDFDGKLREKYQTRCNAEQMAKMKKEMELQRKEIENQKMEKVQEIKGSLLSEIKVLVNKYQLQLEKEPKEDINAFNQCVFLEELYQAVESNDLSLLHDMNDLPYFKQVTEGNSLLSFFSEKTEIGNLFDKAEEQLLQVQALSSEEATDYGSRTGPNGTS
ncbi:hypothetical protein [Legionella resiliens]|uniref:Dot/Icm T4SS effector n=1 Tax=Legionella resiliens TaxID=2905958 RepID=A0ABS8WZT2_9GAMM|nr:MULTISPECIES: hypothetical protein [unclassified Legionella]MCE0721743.1 hypothetical protein [Legionella sp. 9fVS26]MCE3530897.1 hypothetical protein [Legionella sp. 8cVS16]